MVSVCGLPPAPVARDLRCVHQGRCTASNPKEDSPRHNLLSFPLASKTQQYDCKWYIPLTDLSFQMVDESEATPNIPLVPDEELDALKVKISQLKSDIQREKVRGVLPHEPLPLCTHLPLLSPIPQTPVSAGV